MASEIITLKFGINRCYIVKQKQILMIDAGPPNSLKSFRRQLSKYNIQPNKISLIILTHGDFDNIGSAKAIKELTGAKVAIHENERRNLEEGLFNWPPGVNVWGKLTRLVLKSLIQNTKIAVLKADIILTNTNYPLNDFGIDGIVLHTPGYSWGSVSVVLKTGEAFIGCMAHNGFPFRLQPGFPIYADDLPRLDESWYILQENGAKNIYPAHGNPFPISNIIHNQLYNNPLVT